MFDEVPLVPLRDFVKESYPKEMYKMAWELVGPTIHRNQRASLQTLMCIAFIEGMRMAVYAQSKGITDAPAKQEPDPPFTVTDC